MPLDETTEAELLAYAYGELLVLALLHRYDEEGDAFVPRYLDLLRRTGAGPATASVAPQPRPWREPSQPPPRD